MSAWVHANANGRKWEVSGLHLAETDRGVSWEVIGGTRFGFVGFAADGGVSENSDYGHDLPETQQAAIERACEVLDISQWVES